MASSRAVPKDRVRIFDRAGFPLAEFRTSVERSLALGEEGRAQFTYPSRKTDVVSESVLQFGNWLLVENDNLPDWVGVLDPPRTWEARSVTVSAYTPERVFAHRRGPLELVVTGSAGTLFEKILSLVNQAEPTIIVTGSIWRGGAQREETLNPSTLNEDLGRIAERSREEYFFRPITDVRGNLVVYADWTKRFGVGEASSILLQEGYGGGNIETSRIVLVENGPILNDLLGYTDGATWKDRFTQAYVDADSVKKYGLRQDSKQFPGLTSSAAVLNNTKDAVKEGKDAVAVLTLNALNVGETFQYIRLGNRLHVRLSNIGFLGQQRGYDATVRIVGIYYDPQFRNKVELTVETVSAEDEDQ